MKFSTLAVFMLLFLGACSPRLTTLTDQIRSDNRWTEAELSKIQFYLSEDLVLSRERRKGTTTIAQGKVRIEAGREIEEIVFKRGTPGVALFSPQDNRLAIGFDSRDDSKFLIFGANPKMSGKYTLLAKDWQRYRGKVTYGGATWEVSASNADVSLLLDLRKRGTTRKNTSQPIGRRI